MTGERRLQAGLLAALLAASLLTGCGSSTGSQSTASSKGTEAASTQEKLLTSPAPSQETKTLAPGEGERGARVEFVTREHKMERITFSGAISGPCRKKSRIPLCGRPRRAVWE